MLSNEISEMPPVDAPINFSNMRLTPKEQEILNKLMNQKQQDNLTNWQKYK